MTERNKTGERSEPSESMEPSESTQSMRTRLLDHGDAENRRTLAAHIARLRAYADELERDLKAAELSLQAQLFTSMHNLGALVVQVERTLTTIETRRLIRALHMSDSEDA